MDPSWDMIYWYLIDTCSHVPDAGARQPNSVLRQIFPFFSRVLKPPHFIGAVETVECGTTMPHKKRLDIVKCWLMQQMGLLNFTQKTINMLTANTFRSNSPCIPKIAMFRSSQLTSPRKSASFTKCTFSLNIVCHIFLGKTSSWKITEKITWNPWKDLLQSCLLPSGLPANPWIWADMAEDDPPLAVNACDLLQPMLTPSLYEKTRTPW